MKSLEQPGLTSDGSAWLAKALHPSDSTLTVNGIPTLDAVPSAALNFMTTQTIAAPAAASWGCDVLLAPTPLIFGKAIASTGSAFSSTSAYNTTLGVGSFSDFGAAGRTWHAAASNAWAGNVHAHRLMYACVTATLSSSSTSNEGVVTCAQYSLPYTTSYVCSNFNLTGPTARSASEVRCYDQNRRSQSQLQSTAGAVTWDAKRGMYAILKLGTGFDKWVSTRNGTLCMAFNGLPAADAEWVDTASAFNAYGAAAASATDVPFGQQATWALGSVAGSGATTAIQYTGRKMMAPPNDNVAHLSFVGLDPAATLNLTYRVGFEAVVPPESIYAGQVGSPIPMDQVALKTYFNVSREMMAGYPAEYNIFGALVGTAKRLLPKALPVLRNVGSTVLRSFTASNDNASPTYSANPPSQRGLPGGQWVERSPGTPRSRNYDRDDQPRRATKKRSGRRSQLRSRR